MSKEAAYKIFTIRSASLQLRDSILWTPSIAIEWECDGRTIVRPFRLTRTTPRKRRLIPMGSSMACALLTEKSQGFRSTRVK